MSRGVKASHCIGYVYRLFKKGSEEPLRFTCECSISKMKLASLTSSVATLDIIDNIDNIVFRVDFRYSMGYRTDKNFSIDILLSLD